MAVVVAYADTSQFYGVSWADQRDNLVDGVLHMSGHTSASTRADQRWKIVAAG